MRSCCSRFLLPIRAVLTCYHLSVGSKVVWNLQSLPGRVWVSTEHTVQDFILDRDREQRQTMLSHSWLLATDAVQICCRKQKDYSFFPRNDSDFSHSGLAMWAGPVLEELLLMLCHLQYDYCSMITAHCFFSKQCQTVSQFFFFFFPGQVWNVKYTSDHNSI